MTAVLDGEFADYWSAIVASDDHRAADVALAAVGRGVSVEAALMGLVVASQVRVGELWEANEWSVPREHASSAVNEHVVRRLCQDVIGDPAGPLLLVACAEREWHALPALVITQLLALHGARAEYLGPNTSRDHIVAGILDRGPRAVLLSASMSSSLPRVRRQIEAVRGTGTPVIVGGAAFDRAGQRARWLGATGCATTASEALELVERLPRHVPPAPTLRHPGAAEARDVQIAAETLTRSVTRVVDSALGLTDGGEAAGSPDDWRVVLATSIPMVVDCVAGGLLTDDASILTESRDWLRSVMDSRDAPAETTSLVWTALARQLRDHPEATRLIALT
ncbi:B12-binding domain-containing protein [Nocardioides sp.]|uniref:cobalamin B12-binding domain-containing protein n=1 Tax=Nocardioides sp. TaxID=35761 RepID=UPI00356997E7